MNKRRRFAIPEDIDRGFTDVVKAVDNNIGSFRYEVVALSRIETDPENPRELALNQKDIQFGIGDNDHDYERKKREKEQLESLAYTIKQNGVINPIAVYKCGDKYRIIAGERRFLAATLAGKDDIHARIIDSRPNNLDLRLLQWIENNERADLSLKERLINIQAILTEYSKTNNESITGDVLKKLTGLSRVQSCLYLSVLHGPEDLTKSIEKGAINSLDKAGLIANANDDLRKELIVACTEGKSINMLREIIAKRKSDLREKVVKEKKKSNKKGRAAQFVQLGRTKHICVVKKIFEIILLQPSYAKHADKFNLDWNDYKQIANGFKSLLSVIAETEEA